MAWETALCWQGRGDGKYSSDEQLDVQFQDLNEHVSTGAETETEVSSTNAAETLVKQRLAYCRQSHKGHW